MYTWKRVLFSHFRGSNVLFYNHISCHVLLCVFPPTIISLDWSQHFIVSHSDKWFQVSFPIVEQSCSICASRFLEFVCIWHKNVKYCSSFFIYIIPCLISVLICWLSSYPWLKRPGSSYETHCHCCDLCRAGLMSCPYIVIQQHSLSHKIVMHDWFVLNGTTLSISDLIDSTKCNSWIIQHIAGWYWPTEMSLWENLTCHVRT